MYNQEGMNPTATYEAGDYVKAQVADEVQERASTYGCV
jgi:hypothetical protein